MSKRSRVLAALGSTQLTLIILALVAIAIATATFIEARVGTAGARALVYNARWFEVLLALLVVNLTVSLFIRMPYAVRQIGFVITHVGFIVVLLAAGVTRYFGYEGTMPIREGASADFIYSATDHVSVQVDGRMASFPVRFYKPGEVSVSRRVEVGGEPYRVAVREYWPHFETRIVEGAGGTPAVLVSATGAGMDLIIREGERLEASGVTVHFFAQETDTIQRVSENGDLVIELDGEHHHLPVPRVPPAEISVGGYLCRIVEFARNYRVGETPKTTDPMDNPAIRVEVEQPDGGKVERILFAFHPEFDMGHAHGEGAELPLELAYQYARNVYLARDGAAVAARADFPVSVGASGGEADGRAVDAGQRFTLVTGEVVRAGSFVLLLNGVWESAVEKAQNSSDENQPPAVRLKIQDEAGNEAETLALRFREASAVDLGGQDVRMGFGPIRIPLPYRLHLDDFVLTRYPGSNNPAGFESHVRLFDDERGIDGQPVRIYMNHPLGHRGYKHFQSSYDTDEHGTILSVNHDPGKWPTYIGYTLIGIGFLITLTRGAWYRPRAAAATALLCVLPLSVLAPRASAQDEASDPHAGHHHGEIQAPTPNFLSPEAREALSELMVQDFRGRMKPLDTLARESVMKITKRHRHDGWEPVDMYLSWMVHTSHWFEQPVLAVRNADLKKFLGLSPDTKHVTPASLLDRSGRYRLNEDVRKTHRTPDKARSKMQRKLLSFDERVNVFNMALQGLSLRVFPIPDDDNNRWLAPGEFNAEVTGAMEEAVLERYQTAFTSLYGGLSALDSEAVRIGAAAIADIQRTYGADLIPTEAARKAELLFNRLQPFTWATIPYLVAFVILMGAYAWSLARVRGRRLTLRQPLYAFGILLYVATLAYHAWGYVLRWRAGGQAPLSNGYESLIFISLTIAVAGLYYELRWRRGSVGALAAMLTSFILGVAMLPTFDPAISPLVPVLASFWLIIHVTVITASYGFLGLAAVIALTMLVLYLFKGPHRVTLQRAIFDLHRLHWNVLVAGLAFLSVGTFLGGVWANESWGRYWGWDPKETWSLVTILVYAFVAHFRYVEKLSSPITMAAGSFLAISSIGMTYFGVNYFLSGLHSYAQGDAPGVPGWVYITAVTMVLLVLAAFAVDRRRGWEDPAAAGS